MSGEEPAPAKETKKEISNQTQAAQKYKEEGTKLLGEGAIGKAIAKYQLCRMNVQQTAIQKTKAEQEAAKAAPPPPPPKPEGEENGEEGQPPAESEENLPVVNGKKVTPEMMAKAKEMAAQMQQQQQAGGQDPMSMLSAFGGGGGSQSDEEILLCRGLYLASLNNLTHCFIQKSEFTKAVEVATEAINFDPKCVKAYYRRGVAWTSKGNAEKGIPDFEKALELAPGDAAASEKLAWAKQCLIDEKKKEKAAFSKMFS